MENMRAVGVIAEAIGDIDGEVRLIILTSKMYGESKALVQFEIQQTKKRGSVIIYGTNLREVEDSLFECFNKALEVVTYRLTK